MAKWQKVYEDNVGYRIEIVKAILAEHQMNPVVINKKDNAYHFGYFEVHVTSEHVLEAIKIINEEINFE